MKKLFVIIGLALATVMPASAQASFGLRGGLNLVNNDITTVTQESAMSKDSYTGFFFGPMFEFQVPILGVGIDASILYSQKGLEMAEGDNVKEQSINIPVSLKYTFGLGNFLGVFIQAGPQLNYNIGELQYQFESKKNAGEWEEFALEKSVWSVNVGAGVKALNHIQLAVNYNIPITKDGAYNFYGNAQQAADGKIKAIGQTQKDAQEAFKASTLQFILTYTF